MGPARPARTSLSRMSPGGSVSPSLAPAAPRRAANGRKPSEGAPPLTTIGAVRSVSWSPDAAREGQAGPLFATTSASIFGTGRPGGTAATPFAADVRERFVPGQKIFRGGQRVGVLRTKTRSWMDNNSTHRSRALPSSPALAVQTTRLSRTLAFRGPRGPRHVGRWAATRRIGHEPGPGLPPAQSTPQFLLGRSECRGPPDRGG
jgi:hypothetical protein